MTAALLNSSFIQACELDDVHGEAPLHSEAAVLPALFAAAESENCINHSKPISGADLLLAAIVGFEVGPRVGRALYGTELLAMGWHCGTVFGHPAAAAAVSKLFDLSSLQIEDAIGIACTQACGLMSAQFEGMIKRMQHGLASRNGLFSAYLSKGGYKGMRKVFEREYGGFLVMFSTGNSREPAYRDEEIVKDLGHRWDTDEIRIKTHACVGGAHGLIQCIEVLQERYPQKLADLNSISRVRLGISGSLLGHCGWKTSRPITPTGAQMNASYLAAVQLVDRQVLLEQFDELLLNREAIWRLVEKTECFHDPHFDTLTYEMGATVTVELEYESDPITMTIEKPKGIDPPITNEQIVTKYRKLTNGLIDLDRQSAIENAVLGLEEAEDVSLLTTLLLNPFKNGSRIAHL